MESYIKNPKDITKSKNQAKDILNKLHIDVMQASSLQKMSEINADIAFWQNFIHYIEKYGKYNIDLVIQLPPSDRK